MMNFEKLDDKTRKYMMTEFNAEEATRKHRSARLISLGLKAYPELMKKAIKAAHLEKTKKV